MSFAMLCDARDGRRAVVNLIAHDEHERRAQDDHTQQAENAELGQQAEMGHAIPHSKA
jgi:hypothetical protein